MERMQKEHVLEASTNTHILKSQEVIVHFDQGSTQVVETKEATVSHGEHRDITFEAGIIGKFTQKELNPVTRKMQNAFD